MIDLHCHLLPGIDDGPESLPESLDLARMAVDNGITQAILTPHIHPGRHENRLVAIREAKHALESALREAGIPLQLGFAAEVRLGFESLQLIKMGEVPFLGEEDGFRILLLEFPHGHIVPGSVNMVNHLLEMGIRPMIAHPERNKDVIRSLDKITPFVEAGCLLQVTAGSLAGSFGKAARKRGLEMLERGWITVLASDAHNRKYRPPELEPGRKAAARIIGEKAALALVQDRPAQLLGIT